LIEPPGTERYAVGGVGGWGREAPAYPIVGGYSRKNPKGYVKGYAEAL